MEYVEHPKHRAYFAQLAQVIEAGEDARQRRDALIRKLRRADPKYFTHAVLADMAGGLTQQGVSYIVTKPNARSV